MAYQTGSASDVADLVNKISAYAVANGWVLDNDNGASDHCLHSGPNYIRLIGTTAGTYGPWVYAYTGTGYNGAGALVTQSGAAACNWATSPTVEYHLFVTAQYIHCAFLSGNGAWNNLMCGVLTKTNNFEGGTYVAGTNWRWSNHTWTTVNGEPYSYKGNYVSNAYDYYHTYPFDCYTSSNGGSGHYTRVNAVRSALSPDMKNFSMYNNTSADTRGYGGYRHFNWADTTSTYSTTGVYTSTAQLMARSVNQFNGLAVMHPIMVGAHYEAGYFTTLGNPQDVRLINLKYLNAKDIITIGTDEWMVFPAKSKQLIDNFTPYSQFIGYAYLRNA